MPNLKSAIHPAPLKAPPWHAIRNGYGSFNSTPIFNRLGEARTPRFAS